MESSDVWLDFNQVRHTIKKNTVDRLKQILNGLNEECGTHFSKSGKKQEIIDRICGVLDTWKATNIVDKWNKAKGVIAQVRNTGMYTPVRIPTSPVSHTAPVGSNGIYGVPNIHKAAYLSASVGPGSLPLYDPYAPPRKPPALGPTASTSSVLRNTGIRFKESPFYQVDQAVSGIVECPESTGATHRQQQILNFCLTNDQIAKLKAPGSRYQIRLFCTSSIFYPGRNAYRSSSLPCLIEFPPTCEVRVNNIQVTANLKGLKKKPGTAPPPNLGKYIRLSTAQNRVELVYVNSQHPVQSTKYYMLVMLVSFTTVSQLVAELKSSRYRSSHEVKEKMLALSAVDDDIIAGPSKMSLKCPLGFTRIQAPCRSSKCVHPQCFDATNWYQMMEQTTTWLCPVCERILDPKDLILDGYFDEILQTVPDSVEDVIVESDGEWHTSDNHYASAKWSGTHPPPAASSTLSSRSPNCPGMSQIMGANCSGGDESGKLQAGGLSSEICILDSEDEETGRVKQELSPSLSAARPFDSLTVPQTQSQTQTQQDIGGVIDLTLESDDEREPAVPVANQNSKRKASDPPSVSPTEQIWKKGRYEIDRLALPARTSSSSFDNAEYRPTVHAPPTQAARLPPVNQLPPATGRFLPSFQGNTLPPPMYHNYTARGASSSPHLQLPPIVLPPRRPNGGRPSHWP